MFHFYRGSRHSSRCKPCQSKRVLSRYVPHPRVKLPPQPKAPRKTPLQRFQCGYSVDVGTGCWNWSGAVNSSGYGVVWNGSKRVYAHRWSYEQRHGVIPSGLFVLNRCDNPRCVNPVHLFVGTHQDNMDDMRTKGRNYVAMGEDHPRARLTTEQARAIKMRFATEETINEIAAGCRVNYGIVYAIAKGITWQHVS
jgi:hypothetical protein